MPAERETERAYPLTDKKGPGEIETTRVRQGEAPGHMRYVLGISIVLVAVIFAVVYFVYS